MPIQLGNIEKQIVDMENATGDKTLGRRARISLGDITKVNDAIERQTGWGVDLTDGLIQCGVEIDASASMSSEYRNGHVQQLAERTLAWCAVVDSDHHFPAGFFHDYATRPVELNTSNYKGWVSNNVPRLGNTNLFAAVYQVAQMAADALNEPRILELVSHQDYGREVRWNLSYRDLEPVATSQFFHGSIDTDGAATAGPGERFIQDLIVRLSFAGVFIKFKYIGNDPHGERFLANLDDLKVLKHKDDPRDEDVNPGWRNRSELRLIDNVSTVYFPHGLGRVTDEEFSREQTKELDTYVPSAVKRGILLPS